MSGRPVSRPSLFSPIADAAARWELLWPLPLVAVGVAGITSFPLVVGALTLALVPWLARILARRRPSRPPVVGGGLALLTAGALVGVGVSYDRTLSWPALLTLLGSLALFFALLNTPTPPRRVGVALMAVAALGALYFVGQYAYFDYPQEVGRLARLGRFTGSLLPDLTFFTPHPNAAAAFLEGLLPLSLVMAAQSRRTGRLAGGATAVLLAYGLLISGSRGAWLGLAASAAIGVMLALPNWKWRVALSSGAVALTLGLSYPLLHWLSGNPLLGSLAETFTSRLILYRNSLHLLKDYPLTGIGLGETFAMVYSRYQLLIRVPFLTYPHQLFLAVGLGYGLLGVGGLLWLLVGFYRFVARVERAGLDPQARSFFRAAWLGPTVSFVHGMTDSPQFSDSRWTMPVLFALLGLAVMTGREALEQADEERRRGRIGWLLSLGLALTLAVGMGRPLLAAGCANLGAVYQTWAELPLEEGVQTVELRQAVRWFEQALRLDPDQPTANRRLGMIASDRGDFGRAVALLERAYRREPGNQATLKALGLAYLWSGRLDEAEPLLRRLDEPGEMVEELNAWTWWWRTQGRDDLSAYAREMADRLSTR